MLFDNTNLLLPEYKNCKRNTPLTYWVQNITWLPPPRLSEPVEQCISIFFDKQVADISCIAAFKTILRYTESYKEGVLGILVQKAVLCSSSR